MDELKEIIGLIESSRFKQSDYLELDKLNTKTKFGQLYHGIFSGKINNDKEAASIIYNDKASSANYRKLKSRFNDKLYNTLLTLDIGEKGSTPLSRSMFECNKNLILAKILKANGCNRSAFKLVHSSWKIAEKYKLYDLLSQYSNFLAIEYSSIGDLTKYQKYQNLYEKHLKNSGEYDQARKLYMYTEALTIRKSRLTPEIKNKFKAAIKQIDEISSRTDNHHILFIKTLIYLGYYQRTYDFDKLLSECKNAEPFTIKHYGATSSNLLTIYAYDFKSYTNMRMYEEGMLLSLDKKINIAIGHFNWFIMKEYQLQFLMHAEKLLEANEVLIQVKTNKQFKRQDEAIRENWNMLEAYLYYMADLRKIRDIIPRSYIDLRKRIASTITTGDKAGMNTAYLLMKYLIMFRDRKFDELYDSLDAIKVYTNRYLKGEENIRTYTIFKMLQELIKSDFDLHKNKQEPKFLKNLQEAKGPYLVIHEWEIIRYDNLWLASIDNFRR